MDEAISIILRLAESFLINIQLFFATLLFAIPFGFVISFGTMNKWTLFTIKRTKKNGTVKVINIRPISLISKLFVWIIRGTPLLLQILIIYLGPGLLGFTSPWPAGTSGRFIAAVVAFSINYACYFSEIYRGGIEAIPKGQTEAGQVLGMTPIQIFFKIKLLQLTKRIIPPMGNEIITLVKDTALANYISNMEIIMTAREFSAQGLIWPLFSTAIFFLIFVGILTFAFSKIEKKLSYFRA